MDEQVEEAITDGLRRRGIDVLTVREDAREGSDDQVVLDRATELARVLFTRDRDFLKEAALRQQSGESFAGVIYAHQLHVSIGRCTQDLEILAGVYEPDEMTGRVEHLPIK